MHQGVPRNLWEVPNIPRSYQDVYKNGMQKSLPSGYLTVRHGIDGP
jgi:hypothetical protein